MKICTVKFKTKNTTTTMVVTLTCSVEPNGDLKYFYQGCSENELDLCWRLPNKFSDNNLSTIKDVLSGLEYNAKKIVELTCANSEHTLAGIKDSDRHEAFACYNKSIAICDDEQPESLEDLTFISSEDLYQGFRARLLGELQANALNNSSNKDAASKLVADFNER